MKPLIRRLLDRYLIKQPAFRRLVTRAIERDEDRDVTLLGTRLRINTQKEHGYLRAFRRGAYHSVFHDEAGALINLSLILSPGDTFVDVGANVGLFVGTLARRRFISRDVRFYAFEANPDTFMRLKESLRDLDVIIQQVAISDRPGELEFVSGAVSHVFTHASNRNDYHFRNQEPIRVRAQRLDDSGIEGDSFIIKIDVEGQELKVLNGATGLFEQNRVKAVYLDGYDDPAVESFLVTRGFEFFDGRTMRPVASSFRHVLAVRSSV